MSRINVCLSCDNNYAQHAGVTIASILANSNEFDDLHFYILDGGISSENCEKMHQLKNIKNCTINLIKIDENLFTEYKNIKTHSRLPLASFYRLKLSGLLPDIDKIIYFDCDFVVCSSLNELVNIELGDNIIAGVNDISNKKCRLNKTYINSGMVVFDLNKIREQKIEEDFLTWTKENAETIKLGDQEIINEVLKNRIKIIDEKWNVQSSNFINRSSYTNHPKAIHMLAKPWSFGRACIHKKEYYKYLQITPWALNEEDYKHWTIDNERYSIIRYIKKRPFFWLRPHFYVALFYKFLKKEY